MKFPIAFQTFNRRHGFLANRANIRDARMPQISVNEHRARAALAFATTIFAAGQVQLIAQNAQQGSVGRGVNLVRSAVYLQFGDSRGACFG